MNVVVITGASKGLGAEFARQLAARRMDLVLVARSKEPLDSLAEELQERYGIRAYVYTADLSKPHSALGVESFLRENNLHPAWLINNAGFGMVGEFDTQPLDKLVAMMNLNMVTLVELTHLLLPELRLHRDARIINVASTASFQPIPWFNVYAASKTFVLHFSEGLREELRNTDVRVLALCPGPTPTKFFEEAGIPEHIMDKGQSAADVVRLGIKASDRNRTVLVTQRAFLTSIQRLIPRSIVRRIVALISKRMLRSFH